MVSGFEPEGDDAATRSELWRRVSCAVFLMLLAVVVPVLSHYGAFKPPTEGTSAWVMRSGALVTMLALLADHLLAEAVPRLTNALSGFFKPFSLMRKVAALEMILGTAIWGYGDRLFY